MKCHRKTENPTLCPSRNGKRWRSGIDIRIVSSQANIMLIADPPKSDLDGPYARWVCALQFDILNDSLTNVVARLTCFLNLGSGDKPRATSRRSKYWRAWVAANGGTAPRRSDRISPGIFQRRHALVLVADVEKNFKQISLSSDEAYSVVREIIRWETGGNNN